MATPRQALGEAFPQVVRGRSGGSWLVGRHGAQERVGEQDRAGGAGMLVQVLGEIEG
ncbi:hypothetical protein [Micromonospora sp. NPDC049359]|uniref:hypothetical protein n=1 Tax=Micromonospora sp. NPDC049359 TaxID=3364270 RepID=UPI0037BAB1EA